jgi:hypothetical protein
MNIRFKIIGNDFKDEFDYNKNIIIYFLIRNYQFLKLLTHLYISLIIVLGNEHTYA